MRDEIVAYLVESSNTLLRTVGEADTIIKAVTAIRECFTKGGKVLLCGNGGSAADCQHLAAEWMGVMGQATYPRPAIALTTDTSFLTAWSNDRDYQGVFERQIWAIGKAGDVLLAISTSGNSANVARAVWEAKERGLTTILLTGRKPVSGAFDHVIRVPSEDTQHIQEAHIAIGHLLCLLTKAQPVEAPVVSQTYQEAFTEKYNRSRDLGWDHDEAVRRATHEAAHYQ